MRSSPDRSDAGRAQALLAATTRIAFGIASWRRPLRARRPTYGVERRAAQHLVARLAAAAGAERRAARSAKAATLTSASFGVEVDQRQAAAAVGLQLQLVERRTPAAARRASGRRPASPRRRAIAGGSGFSSPSRARKALPPRWRDTQVAGAREQAEAAGAGEQQHLRRRAGEVVRRLRAGLEVDQRGDRLAVAAPARQRRDRRPSRRGRCCRRRAGCRRCGRRRCRRARRRP